MDVILIFIVFTFDPESMRRKYKPGCDIPNLLGERLSLVFRATEWRKFPDQSNTETIDVFSNSDLGSESLESVLWELFRIVFSVYVSGNKVIGLYTEYMLQDPSGAFDQ